MTHKSRGPEDYIPFRVVEESYFRSPRPPYASLAHAAGRTVADTMIEGSLLDHRGRPLKTVPMALVSKHEPSAGRSYALEGLTIRHPMKSRRYASYRGLPSPEFERGRLIEPEDLAVAVVEALRRTFEGSRFWEPKPGIFRSGQPDIGYNDLAITLAEVGAIQPEGPMTTWAFSEYAARVGGQALLLATGAEDTGGTQLFPHTHILIPKAEELRLL